MINSELLKEAIADAKAVRVTAYANAKASLEEAFLPRFEAMFADKLKEESEEEEQQETTMQEVEAPNQVSGTGGEAKGPKTKPVTKGQPKKKSDANTNWKVVRMGQGPTDVPSADNKIDETYEEEEEGKVDEMYEEEGKQMDEAGLTSEELDEIIKELEAEVSDEEEGKRVEEPFIAGPPDQHGQHGQHGEENEEEPVAPEEDPSGESKGEPEFGHEEGPEGHHEPDGDEEGIPPMEGEPEGLEGEPGEEEPVDVEAEPGSEVDVNLGPEAGEEAGAEMPPRMPPQFAGKGRGEEDEEINLEELLAALNEEADEEEEEEKKMDETTSNHGVPTNDLKGQNAPGGVKGYPKTTSNKEIEAGGKNHNIKGKGNIGTGAEGGKPMREAQQYKVALKEAYNTIEFLRGQINEVNLLNAKLLYTNKLFKEFATVIDDPYRVKIVEAFDLTKSVREVKLAYALLAESLNFGRSKKVASPSRTVAVQKSALTSKRNPIVSQITEGYASARVASTKPSKEILSEGANVMAERFKKLAGIKTPVEQPKK